MQISLRSILFIFFITVASYAGDFSITVNSVGIGNNWRAGEITPVHITVNSNTNEPVQAWIQWEVPDADGDLVLWGRAITLSPMTDTSTWLYAPTRAWDNGDTVWTIRLRELEDNVPSGELELLQFSPYSVRAIYVPVQSAITVIFGTRRLGLPGYLPVSPETKQETSFLVSGLKSKDLPDAWPCFTSLEALVWADAVPEFSFRQTQAIEDWVFRGGHFVITLPNIGDPWALGRQNAPLANLTQGVDSVITQVPIEKLQTVLGNAKRLPQSLATVQIFGNIKDEWDTHYTPILWLEDGSVIAVQKTFGFGSLTVIGIDVASGNLSSLGLPKTDIFWNRIFGKRNTTPSTFELQKLKDDNELSPTISKVTYLLAGNLIAQYIAMSTTASGKLGTVFIVILLYWIVACPGGFYFLYRCKKLQWSWVLFVSSAIIFTGGTWVLAGITSGISTPIKHVSIIDHVYGGTGQKVTGWFSVFLPNFGYAKITLHGESNNLLTPWAPPDASMTPDFIDRREVLLNLDSVPNSFNQPARSTTANFAFDWVGGIDSTYFNSLIRVDPNNVPRVDSDSSNGNALSGTIKNNASGIFQDVTIIWVTDEQNDNPNQVATGRVLNKMHTWRFPYLKNSEELNFNSLKVSNLSSFTNAVKARYQIEELFQSSGVSDKDWHTKMEMLSFYSHLSPPIYKKNANAKQGPASHRSIREGGRELDLSTWFSRPCIIVMGFLHNSPIPVDISMDGEQINKSAGTTLVRWVYPLEQSQ
jgi:hypothetical protein